MYIAGVIALMRRPLCQNLSLPHAFFFCKAGDIDQNSSVDPL
jgi:hypothetical protein